MSDMQSPKTDIRPRQEWPSRAWITGQVPGDGARLRSLSGMISSHVWLTGQLLAQGYKPCDIAVLLQVRLSVVRSWQRQWRRMLKRLGEHPFGLELLHQKEKIVER